MGETDLAVDGKRDLLLDHGPVEGPFLGTDPLTAITLDARRSLYWITYARDPGKAAWIWAITITASIVRDLYPLYRDALIRGLQKEAAEYDMALKGFIWAWITIIGLVSVWITLGLSILPRHPFVADGMNWTLTGLILWWIIRTEKGPKDSA